MCGSRASRGFASMDPQRQRELAAANDGIVQGFGAVLSNSRDVIAVSEPRRITLKVPGPGADRALAVAAHLRIANRALVRDYEEYSNLGLPGVSIPLQAGAAATEAMADALEALVAGDGAAFRSVIELFVNDAVDTGVVTL